MQESMLLGAGISVATEQFGTVQETQGNLTGDSNLGSGIRNTTHARQDISVVIPAGKRLTRIIAYLSKGGGTIDPIVDAGIYDFNAGDSEPDNLILTAGDPQTITNTSGSGDRVGTLQQYIWNFTNTPLPSGAQYFAALSQTSGTADRSVRIGVMSNTVNAFNDTSSGVSFPDPFTDISSINVNFVIWGEFVSALSDTSNSPIGSFVNLGMTGSFIK